MGSSAQVTFAFLAKDAASSTIRGLSKTLGGLSSVAGRVGGILTKTFKAALIGVGGAIAGASAALVKFTKDAIDDEAAQSRLTAVLKARGLATKENLAATEAMIKSGARLAFTDDDIREGLATATQFTKNFASAQRLVTSAQDVARAKNISLEAATKLVGKAYLGQTRGLTALGIELDKNAKKSEILRAVQGKFGGSAKTYATTTAGAIQSVQIAIAEAGETIGTAFLPIINEMLNLFYTKGLPIIESVSQGIADFVTNNKELIKSVIETTVGFVSNLIPVLVSVGEFIFGTIIPAVVGFVEKLTSPGGVTDSIGKVVGPILDNLIPAFGKFLDGVGKLIGKIGEFIGVLWGDGSGPLAIAVTAIGGAFSILLSIFGNIGGAIATAIDFIMKLGKAIMDSPIGFLIKAIAGIVGGAAGAIGGAFGLGNNSTPSFAGASPSNTGSYGPAGGYNVTNSVTFGRDAYTSVNTTLGASTRTSTGTRVGGR